MKVSPNIRRDAASVLAFKAVPEIVHVFGSKLGTIEVVMVPKSLLRKARRVAKWVAEQQGKAKP